MTAGTGNEPPTDPVCVLCGKPGGILCDEHAGRLDPPIGDIERDWLNGMKPSDVAAKYGLTHMELYQRLKHHPGRRARWN